MNKNKILIIDDDVDLLATTELFLKSNNYEVSTAINTKKGKDIIKSFHPDLIILDVMMDTNLEGFNFLDELKSDEFSKEIPIIVNTSMSKSLGVNLRSAVEDDENIPRTKFIDKTGDWEELLKTIRELI